VTGTYVLMTVGICLLPIVPGFAVCGRLPATMATHWNFQGAVDDTMPQTIAIVCPPVGLALVQGLMAACMMRQTKKRTTPLPGLFLVSLWLLPVISVVMNGMVVLYNLGVNIPVVTITLLLAGLMFILIGFEMPRTNYEDGRALMRPVPRSEQSYERLTRRLGMVWMIVGVVMVALALIM